MKKAYYSEIIDLVEEQKEYSRLCQGKSKKYKQYTDWEEHIEACLSNLNTEKDLYNFKRYCKNAERTSSRMPEFYVTYILLLVTVYIDKVFTDIPWYLWLIPFVGLLIYVIVQHKKVVKDSYFFTDILEIIERIEQQD